MTTMGSEGEDDARGGITLKKRRNNGRFVFGLFLILLVAAFWGGASVLVQYIYCDLQFQSALFVTLAGSILLSFYLPLFLILERCNKMGPCCCCYYCRSNERRLWHTFRRHCCSFGLYPRTKEEERSQTLNQVSVVPWSSGPKPVINAEAGGVTPVVKIGNNDGRDDIECVVNTDTTTEENEGKYRRRYSEIVEEQASSTGGDRQLPPSARRRKRNHHRSSSPYIFTIVNDLPYDEAADDAIATNANEVSMCPSSESDDDCDYNNNITDNDDGEDYCYRTLDESDSQSQSILKPKFVYGHVEHMKSALIVSPILLLATVCHDLSLKWTSVTSMMVLSSTSTVFAFGFAVLAKDEKFSLQKAVAVALCVMGSIVTAIADSSSEEGYSSGEHGVCGSTSLSIDSNLSLPLPPVEEDNSSTLLLDAGEEAKSIELHWRLLGDLAGLLSAAGYGAYSTALRLRCPDDGSTCMELLFGYVGLLNTMVLIPVVYTGWQIGTVDLSNLSWTVLGYIALVGIFNDVLSEYLWAKSVVLTSSTIANVGLSLTVPMAFTSDWILRKGRPTMESLVGALTIVIGFVLVTIPSSSLPKDEMENRKNFSTEEMSALKNKANEGESTEGRRNLNSNGCCSTSS